MDLHGVGGAETFKESYANLLFGRDVFQDCIRTLQGGAFVLPLLNRLVELDLLQPLIESVGTMFLQLCVELLDSNAIMGNIDCSEDKL